MDLKLNLVKGMLVGSGGVALKTVLNLVFIPVIIGFLGPEYYGFYVFLLGVSELLASVDLGFTVGLVHRLGHFSSSNLIQEYREQLRIGLILYSILAVLILGLGIALNPLLTSFFKLSPKLTPIANISFLIIVADGAVNLLGSYFRAVLRAKTLYYWTNLSEILQSILINLLGYLALLAGYGLIEVLCIRLIITTLQQAFLLNRSLHVEPLLFQSGIPFSWQAFKELYSVSFFSLINRVGTILSNRMDTVVLASFLGMTQVGMYALVVRIFGQVSYLCMKLLEGVFPTFSQLTDREHARNFFLRISCFVNYFLILLLVIMGIFFREVFDFLSHGEFRFDEALPVACLVLPVVWTSTIQLPASDYLFTHNQYRYTTSLYLTAALINLALGIMLVPLMGVTGVAISTLIPHTIEHQIFIIPRACRMLNIPYAEYLTQVYFKNLFPWLTGVVLMLLLKSAAVLTPYKIPLYGACIMIGVAASAGIWLKLTATSSERRFIQIKMLAPLAQKLKLHPNLYAKLMITDKAM